MPKNEIYIQDAAVKELIGELDKLEAAWAENGHDTTVFIGCLEMWKHRGLRGFFRKIEHRKE